MNTVQAGADRLIAFILSDASAVQLCGCTRGTTWNTRARAADVSVFTHTMMSTFFCTIVFSNECVVTASDCRFVSRHSPCATVTGAIFYIAITFVPSVRVACHTVTMFAFFFATYFHCTIIYTYIVAQHIPIIASQTRGTFLAIIPIVVTIRSSRRHTILTCTGFIRTVYIIA